MKVGIPKETAANERRVALTPDMATRLVGAGLEVSVQSGAGEEAFFTDELYTGAGATVAPDAAALLGGADVVLKVQSPSVEEVDMMSQGSAIIAFLQPLNNRELVKKLAERGITSFSMDTVPRIARAQSMDALSSMSSLAGYKAALIAANSIGKYFPMMITAAGTYAPAKGLVLGAGVAGLQAIATARRLGAVMQAFDVRPVVKEQVESLGATFVGMAEEQHVEDAGGYARELAEESQRKERELIHTHARDADFIISTALIPGRPAPPAYNRGHGQGHEGRLRNHGLGSGDGRELRADRARLRSCQVRRHYPRASEPPQQYAGPRQPDVLAEHIQSAHASGEGRRAEPGLQ